MLLPNGSMIKQDVIDAFNKAVVNPENLDQNGAIDWDFVDADIHLDLSKYYASDYLGECLDALADDFILHRS
ncbi:MAG: hypothetical protein N0C84_00660 [Candidatus Thiodiazotropha taylori]|uniref:Uncharacterized protein n=1 Tax=Candidatus Thiodiazotropha taylori TaxID=2792791 RepID=A0A9E4K8I0_9GAMM|nr:hypothetical protein [Candidatus Thiodiazotropha taylori]MCW4254956.1 hypothetical protein [Candidatus Thiodiazotropha taylori]